MGQDTIVDHNMAQWLAVIGGFTSPTKAREAEFYASIEGKPFFKACEILARAPDWGREFKNQEFEKLPFDVFKKKG